MSGPGLDAFDAIQREARVLLAAAETLSKRVEALAGRGEAIVELAGVDAEVTAADAVHLRLGAKLTDRAACLVAALRTGNSDLDVIGVQLDHLDAFLAAAEPTNRARVGERPKLTLAAPA